MILFIFAVRLNNGPNSHAGGLEIHKDGKWYGVCDSSFDRNAALVACRSIKPKTYVDARPIPGEILDFGVDFLSLRFWFYFSYKP